MMERSDILADFVNGIVYPIMESTHNKTEYGALCGPNGVGKLETAILFSKAFAEMIEISEIQAIFRKYGIQFIYKVPIAERAK